MPEREPNLKKKISVAIVETSATAEARARDLAEDKLNREVAEATGVKGFLARIWKNNLAYDYYRQKAIGEARGKIYENGGNLYADRGADRTAHENAMRAVVAQFTSEHADRTMHEDAGERRAVLAGPEEQGLRDKIKLLVMEYATRDLNDPQTIEAFMIERAKIIEDEVVVKKADVLDEKKGDRQRMFADNLLEVARTVQTSIEHGEALSDIDLDFEVVVGRARAGVRTEAQLDTVDRIVDTLQQHKIGRLFNETTVAGGVAIAYLVSAGLSKRVASSRLAAWGTFGATALLAGGFAWGKERRRIEKDRALHARQRAEGKEKPVGEQRLEELEESRYETKTAAEIAFELNENIQLLQHEKTEGVTPEARLKQIHDAYLSLHDIEFRIEQSDRENIDLISFSDATKVVEERYELDVLRATLKTKINKIIDTEPEAANLFATEEKTLVLEVLGKKTVLEEDVKRKDRLFSRLKEKKALVAAVKAASIGLVIGAGAQEAVSWLRDDQRGIVEGVIERIRAGEVVAPPEHVSAFEWLRMKAFAEESYVQDGGPTKQWIGSNQIAMPDGFSFEKDVLPPHNGAPETYTLQRNGTVVASGLMVDNTGLFTPESHAILKSHNLDISTPEEKIVAGIMSQTVVPGALVLENVPTGRTLPMSPQDYLSSRSSEMQTIKRVLWYDNDTPAPKFEKNELRLWQGGVKDTGIDKNGNYAYSVRALMEKGSYHGKQSINARELMQDGKLKLLLSLSKGTQNQVFEVPIDAKGNAIIDPTSEAGKTLFKNVGGKMQFVGAFAEVAHSVGNKDGVEQVRILATEVGRNNAALPEVPQYATRWTTGPSQVIEETTAPTRWTETRLQTGGPTIDPPPIIPIVGRKSPYETPRRRWSDTRLNSVADPAVDPPPSISILGSKPLEPLELLSRDQNVGLGNYFMDTSLGGEEVQAEKERSKTLNNNVDADLDPYDEVSSYLEKQDSIYLTKLETLVEQAGPMDPNCKLSLCIPVAGHQEQDNIYKTLERYLNQTAATDTFELALYVNQPDKDMADKPILADKTLDEIQRFRNDHPDLKVRVMKEILPRDEAVMGNIRKRLNDAVLLRHHSRGSETSDHIMVSNDADNKGLAPTYVQNFIEKFNSKPTVDAMLGQLDWDPESYIRNPVVHIGTRLFQYVYLQMRRGRAVGSSGANFAFRSSIYAGVGGYPQSQGGGEDSVLGRRIKYARADSAKHTPIIFAGARVSRLYTSSRRAEKTVADGLTPYEQWEKAFSAFDDEVRKVKWENLGRPINFDNPEEVAKLKTALEACINRTIRVMSRIEQTNMRPFQRSLRWLGVKCVSEENGVRITDISRLIEELRGYQKDGMKILQQKITQP